MRTPLRCLGWILMLFTALSGCSSTDEQAKYPAAWPSRIATVLVASCLDISGTYRATDGRTILPFLVSGITAEDSFDWQQLVQAYEAHLLPDPEGTTVTIAFPDPEHIDAIVATRGSTVARHTLKRSYQSDFDAVMFGQHERSFRCEPDGVVINSAYIHDWSVYSLSDEEKKRRFRRLNGAVGPLGVSEGYVHFSKTTEGDLVARVSLYGCYPCKGLDEYWQRWGPTQRATLQSRAGVHKTRCRPMLRPAPDTWAAMT